MQLSVHVTKADYTFELGSVESLSPASLEYLIQYGAEQSIRDTTAGVKRTDYDSVEKFNAAALEKAQKRVDQIISGNVPGSRTPSTPAAIASRAMSAFRALGVELTPEQLAALEGFKKAA